MSIVVPLISALLAIIATACVWQHFKYLGIRRNRVDDATPLFYPASTFHVLNYIKVAPGRDKLDELRALRASIEQPGGGSVVYAGLVAVPMALSTKVSNDWDGLLLTQYASRQSYENWAKTKEYSEVLGRCENTFVYGAIRKAGLNLMIPLALLGVRVFDFIRREPKTLPYIPVGDDAMPALKEVMKRVTDLDDYRAIKDDAVVIYNLIKKGTKAQQSADRAYGLKMVSGMAEASYGPMHMGTAVQLEDDVEFEQFAVVYYPGIDHVQKMVGSTFMNRIGSGKQLGDTIAVATIPVLSKL